MRSRSASAAHGCSSLCRPARTHGAGHSADDAAQRAWHDAFCMPSHHSLLRAVPHPAANELIPEMDDALTLASHLHPQIIEAIAGNLLHSEYSVSTLEYGALGICARWHSATQDVDFERKLLLRALLGSCPPRRCRVTPGCTNLDEVDLAPLKVPGGFWRRVTQRWWSIDLNSSQFRWDVRQPPPREWGEAENQGGGSGSVIPPLAGLSKLQLGGTRPRGAFISCGDECWWWWGGGGGGGDGGGAAQLGIGSRQHKRILSALRLSGAAATGRCALRHGGDAGGATPSHFATDNEFFEWQERQAALFGASLHDSSRPPAISSTIRHKPRLRHERSRRRLIHGAARRPHGPAQHRAKILQRAATGDCMHRRAIEPILQYSRAGEDEGCLAAHRASPCRPPFERSFISRVVLVGRLPEPTESRPGRHVTTILTTFASLLRSEIAPAVTVFGEPTSRGDVERLSCFEAILKQHGVGAESAGRSIRSFICGWSSRTGNFNNVLMPDRCKLRIGGRLGGGGACLFIVG